MVKEETDTPALNIVRERFSHFLGEEISSEEICRWIPYLGLDLEDVGEEEVKIEYNPNRPDLGIVTGIVKAFKGITGREMGLIHYKVEKGDYRLIVDEKVKEARPYVLSAVVKDIPMDEETLVDIINLQEDLHETIGRRRRKVSIGIHNLDVVKFPVHYLAMPGETSFIPLDEEREMSLTEILTELEKGREYSHILEGKKLYPIIADDRGEILSFPPIINSEYTRVGPETRNLFLDITGTDLKAIDNVCRVLVTSLADLGGKIWSVRVEAPHYQVESPDLAVKEMKVDPGDVRRLLGLDLSLNEMIQCLRACRFDAGREGENLIVSIPPYRVDIMHPVDIVEEVAIGYGYWRIEPVLPEIFLVGEKDEAREFASMVSQVMMGAGYLETVNFTLTSIESQFLKMGLKPEGFIRVKNPKSLGYEILRVWIIPSLLEVCHVSKKETYPQQIFEVGKIVYRRGEGWVEETHLGAVKIGVDAGYSDVKSLLDALCEALEVKAVIESMDHPSFIPGRVGRIVLDGVEGGLIGELHPQVLENFQLENPVACLELNIDLLRKIYKGKVGKG